MLDDRNPQGSSTRLDSLQPPSGGQFTNDPLIDRLVSNGEQLLKRRETLSESDLSRGFHHRFSLSKGFYELGTPGRALAAQDGLDRFRAFLKQVPKSEQLRNSSLQAVPEEMRIDSREPVLAALFRIQYACQLHRDDAGETTFIPLRKFGGSWALSQCSGRAGCISLISLFGQRPESLEAPVVTSPVYGDEAFESEISQLCSPQSASNHLKPNSWRTSGILETALRESYPALREMDSSSDLKTPLRFRKMLYSSIEWGEEPVRLLGTQERSALLEVAAFDKAVQVRVRLRPKDCTLQARLRK